MPSFNGRPAGAVVSKRLVAVRAQQCLKPTPLAGMLTDEDGVPPNRRSDYRKADR